ncbi:thiamine pyrophosphate-binding protein [Microlunatus speluncae]|uniref:thiamine pyrophosphate-binding protein n=1 Tax=Microlunatus speluncae TaxID=2594267 RepID=UPI00126670D7|nr:thiamine pyrophosphate-binding protein [Microlunatus speluncae]
MSNVSAQVAAVVADHVTEIFGVMGNGNAYFLDALAGTGTRFTAVRHEAGGVAAADAYHRASGRLAAATATYGPGFSNAITPLAEAVRARIPLVLITGAAPTSGPRPWDVDQTALAAAVGAPTIEVGVSSAATETRRAIEYALAERTPVVIAIPYDLATVEAGEIPALAAIPVPPPVVPTLSDLTRVAGLIRSARRPVILAGRGAWLAQAGPVLTRLANAIKAPVATTACARSLFGPVDDHLGMAGGFGTERCAAAFAAADLVLVFGAGLNQFTTRFGRLFGDQTTVIQIDLAAPTEPRVDLAVRGDVALAAAELIRQLPARTSRVWTADHPGLSTVRESEPGPSADGLMPDGRLDPRQLARRLDPILPADRTVVTDGGHFLEWGPRYWRVAAPDRLIMVGTAYQTIGLGLSSAVGAARARPESTLVLASGDGGALMALADLESLARAARRAVMIIFNDGVYGAEVHQYGVRGLDPGPMQIGGVDFAGLGRAVGAAGRVVRTLDDLDDLTAWLAGSGSGLYVADCRISTTVVAPHMREVQAQAGLRPSVKAAS